MATDFRRKEELSDLTDRIVASYQDIGSINHLGHCPLPSTEAVIEIAQDLKEVIFPGYRRRQNLHMGNVTFYVGDLIDSLHDRLTQQFARALRHADDLDSERECSVASLVDYERDGQLKAIAFLKRLPGVRRVLASDVQAAFDGDPTISTRSFPAIPGSKRSPSTVWHTNCSASLCR
jgi:serine O-acetyltransferase